MIAEFFSDIQGKVRLIVCGGRCFVGCVAPKNNFLKIIFFWRFF